MQKIDRRSALKLIGGAAAFAVVPSTLVAKADGDWIELTARPVEHKLHHNPEALPSNLWGYNGQISGPLLRFKQGQIAKIRFKNELPEATSIHWHGIRIENKMDGVSGLTQKPVEPGETFEYVFTLPDAGTYWYHAHNNSWSHVARGLYGPLIIDQDVQTRLPEHQDITLMLDDWRLNSNGQFDEASLGSLMEWSHGGRMGNWLTVNGQSLPTFDIAAGIPTLLRLVNACNSRILELDPNRFGAKVVGFDGQPRGEGPIELDYAPLLLGPAQRVDLLINTQSSFALEEVSGQAFPFCFFDVQDIEAKHQPYQHPKTNSLPVPAKQERLKFKLRMTGGAMGTIEDIYYQGQKLDAQSFQKSKQFWAFNGVANLSNEPLFAASQGETVEVEIENTTAFMHAMHIHGHHFLIEDRDGSGVEHEGHWRDTFLVGPRQKTTISFVADNIGKWLFHCHMLEHAAAGMNAWFEVS